MKTRTGLLALGLGITTLALTAAPSLGANGGNKGGTDVLHITVRTALSPNSFDPDAAGSLGAMLRQQGKADIQKLRLDVSNLAPNAAYFLFVVHAGGTPTGGVELDTDANGEASLSLMHHGNGKGNGKTFPAGLDPLSDVVEIQVLDGADPNTANLVLDADFTTPDSLNYLVKRHLTSHDGVADGAMFLKAHGSQTSFRLVAVNLAPNASYTLSVGDGVNPDATATLTADANGRLETTDLPAGAPDAFHIRTVKLIDGTPAVVLDTTLP